MSIQETLTNLAAPFAHLYNHSKPLSIGTTYAHLASMVWAGGLAIAGDRTTLRLKGDDVTGITHHVKEQSAMHRAIIFGLAISAASGVMLFASDVDTFFPSKLYWAKIGSVFLLLANGLRLAPAERRLAADPTDAKAFASLRNTAWVSLLLWFVVAFLGTMLKTEA
jgi:hypothetical protein